MHLLSKLFRSSGDEPAENVDVKAVLAACRVDPRSATAALQTLDREQKRLLRQRDNLQKRMRRFSSTRVRDIGRSGPQFGPIQLQVEMQMRDDVGQDYNLSLQESDLEERLQDIEAARVAIKGILARGS